MGVVARVLNFLGLGGSKKTTSTKSRPAKKATVKKLRKKATAAAAKEKKPSAKHEALLEARCPICFENWDVNVGMFVRACCYKRVCEGCFDKSGGLDVLCPLCRCPYPRDDAEELALSLIHI